MSSYCRCSLYSLHHLELPAGDDVSREDDDGGDEDKHEDEQRERDEENGRLGLRTKRDGAHSRYATAQRPELSSQLLVLGFQYYWHQAYK